MPGLTSYHLKLIAALTMVVDHIGVLFYPHLDWLRMIGRVSFPLFIWLLTQGEAHTKDIWRYGLRLGLFRAYLSANLSDHIWHTAAEYSVSIASRIGVFESGTAATGTDTARGDISSAHY